MTSRPLRRFVIMLVLASLVASCDSTSPNTAHVGTYQLITVNGAPLPQNWDITGNTKVVGGVVMLAADGGFKDSTALRDTLGRDLSHFGIGIYERNGDTITFVPILGDVYTMRFSSAALTLTQQVTPGLIFVYKR